MKPQRQITDAVLLMSLREDSREAFAGIYERYWQPLLAIAYAHSRNKTVAEEIVQEVFISLWNRRKDLHIDNVSAYLATAVRLAVFKQYVRQKRRTEIAMQATDPQIAIWEEEKIHTRFLQQQINGIVETLPEKCRLVFKLSRTDGLTIREIASSIGISQKTAEAHLTKALKELRLKL